MLKVQGSKYVFFFSHILPADIDCSFTDTGQLGHIQGSLLNAFSIFGIVPWLVQAQV